MPGFLLHVGATVSCMHGGTVSITTANSRVLVGGQPAVTANDTYTVTGGCAFAGVNPPHPCVKLQWTGPAAKVRVNGQAVVLATSAGQGLSAAQAPQGAPIVTTTQMKVKGT